MKKAASSIKTWILFPFLLLIGTSFFFSMLISIRDSQRIVNNTFEELSNEINNRVKDKIATYLSIPHLINQINHDAIELKNLNFDNQKEAQTNLAKQLISFRSDLSKPNGLINAIYYVTATQNKTKNNEYEFWSFWSSEYNPDEQGVVSLFADSNTKLTMHAVKQDTGEILGIMPEQNENPKNNNKKAFNPTIRPWFKAGEQDKYWSKIYKDATTDELVITATKLIKKTTPDKKI